MWEVFGMIYGMFQKDGVDYFTGMLNINESMNNLTAGWNKRLLISIFLFMNLCIFFRGVYSSNIPPPPPPPSGWGRFSSHNICVASERVRGEEKMGRGEEKGREEKKKEEEGKKKGERGRKR